MAISTIKGDNSSYRMVNFQSLKGTVAAGGIYNIGKLWVINARITLTENIPSNGSIGILPFSTPDASSVICSPSDYDIYGSILRTSKNLSAGDTIRISATVIS